MMNTDDETDSSLIPSILASLLLCSVVPGSVLELGISE
jgi:hypothetical protein